MHDSCENGECYATLFKELTTFEMTRELLCNGCAYTGHKYPTQCILHAEARGNAETSIQESLAVAHVDFDCEACDSKHAKQQHYIDTVPQFMVVHINKYANCIGPATPPQVRIAGTAMQRVAVLHHSGHTPNSGHHTCAVAKPEGMAYQCNDATISPQPGLIAQP